MSSTTPYKYKYGFTTEVETETLGKGLNEEIIREISRRKEEPDFMLKYRLKAFRHWQKMKEPDWAQISFPKIDFQDLSYYSAPKQRGEEPKSLEQIDPELLATFEKLGIPISEQKRLTGRGILLVQRSPQKSS